MNEKGYTVLNHLIKQGYENRIDKVVGAKDNNVKKDFYSEIKKLCEGNKVKFFDRKNNIKDLPFYKIAVGWRWIIKDSEKLIVLHDSILPKYRGFAPLVNMLINGEKKIGVTALLANVEFDKGDILGQRVVDIEYPIKIRQAINIMAFEYSKLVIEIINGIGRIKPIPQIEKNATYSLWRDEKDYFIDWTCSAKKIRRFIDAVGYPYSGARCIVNGEVIVVEEAEVVVDVVIENRDIGKVIFKDGKLPVVVCGEGLLKISKMVTMDNRKFDIESFRVRFI